MDLSGTVGAISNQILEYPFVARFGALVAMLLFVTFAFVPIIPFTVLGVPVKCDDMPVWDWKADGGFPESKILKQRLRDLVWPERALGHADREVAK